MVKVNEKKRRSFNQRETFEIFNSFCLSFILPPHSPSAHQFSYSRVILHQTLDDTLEYSAPKMCRVLLRAQEHSIGDSSLGKKSDWQAETNNKKAIIVMTRM